VPAEQELPSTLRRSSSKAQETWSEAHDSAVETYGEGERAHRTAFAALKHSFEKVGDHWEPKRRKGRSDPRLRVKDARHGSVEARHTAVSTSRGGPSAS
jgi:cation transport regulator ChaB